MINVTSAFRNVLKSGNKKYVVDGKIFLQNTSAEHLSRKTGTVITFTLDNDRIPIYYSVVRIDAWQEGAGIPSSSNVRAIHGYDVIKAVITGKNICPSTDKCVPGYLTATGALHEPSADNPTLTTDFIRVKPGTSYVCSVDATQIPQDKTPWFGLCYYDQNRNFISRVNGNGQTTGDNTLVYFTRTTTADTAFVRFSYRDFNVGLFAQIEEGSTPTAYEMYGQEITIQLPEIIYGGELDIGDDAIYLYTTHGYIAEYAGETIGEPWVSSIDEYVAGTTPSIGAEVIYTLDTEIETELSSIEPAYLRRGLNSVYFNSGYAQIIYLEPIADITLSDSNIIAGSLSWDSALCGDDSFGALGAVPINSLTFSLDNRNNNYTAYDFYNAEVVINVGLYTEVGTTTVLEKINKGYYVIEDVKYTGAAIRITAVDYLSRLDKPYVPSTAYPAQLSIITQDICNACGILLNSIVFPNSTYTIQTEPTFPEGTTYRQVLSWVATLAGCFARMNAQGRLELKWFNTTTLSNYASINYTSSSFRPETAGIFYINSIFSQTIGIDYITITGVRAVLDDTTYLEGSDTYAIDISENNAFITSANVSEVLSYLGSVLIGMAFHKAAIQHTSDPTIEIGDIAVVHDYARATNYPIVITRTTFGVFQKQTTISAATEPLRHSSTRNTEGNSVYQKVVADLNEERTERQIAQAQFAQQLANATGLYSTQVIEESGDVASTIYYLHDKSVLQESNFVMKFTGAGIGLASEYQNTLDSQGAETTATFPWGLDYTGTTILNKIYAEGIDADYITAGRIRSRTPGGTYWDLETGELRLSSTTQLSNVSEFSQLSSVVAPISSWVQIKTEQVPSPEDPTVLITREYLELGSTDMTLTTTLRNGELAFWQGNTKVAYISDEKLYITDAHFLNSIQLGDFAFFPRNNGNLSFLKVN